MFQYVYMYIVQQYAPLMECIVEYWFQCPWILSLTHPRWNLKPLSLTQFQVLASQFNLEIRINLETTARLMFLSQFVLQIFISVHNNVKEISDK